MMMMLPKLEIDYKPSSGDHALHAFLKAQTEERRRQEEERRRQTRSAIEGKQVLTQGLRNYEYTEYRKYEQNTNIMEEERRRQEEERRRQEEERRRQVLSELQVLSENTFFWLEEERRRQEEERRRQLTLSQDLCSWEFGTSCILDPIWDVFTFPFRKTYSESNDKKPKEGERRQGGMFRTPRGRCESPSRTKYRNGPHFLILGVVLLPALLITSPFENLRDSWNPSTGVEPGAFRTVILRCDDQIPCFQGEDAQDAIRCVCDSSRSTEEISWVLRSDVFLDAMSAEDGTVPVTHVVEAIVQPRPSSIPVKGCTLLQPCFSAMQRGEPIINNENTVLPQAGLNIEGNLPNGIASKPATAILRENGPFYNTTRGHDAMQKPREVNQRQSWTFRTLGGRPKRSSYTKNINQPKLTILGVLLQALLILSQLGGFYGASNTEDPSVQCPPQQRIELGRTGIVRCAYQENVSRVYWFNDVNEVLIQFENGNLDGPGYNSGELDLQPDGSLVINTVDIHHENTYRVEFLDSDLKITSYNIAVTVYVEPIERQPVIQRCDGHIPCIQRRDPTDVMLCVHENSRPVAEISWFRRIQGNDVFLNATINKTQSSDSTTFTTYSSFDLSAISATSNPLVLLVCKSNQPITTTGGSESQVLVDFSIKDPFRQENDVQPTYAFEGDTADLILDCHSGISTATTSAIFLWLYKSLNSGRAEYLLYSAYGNVLSSLETDTHFTITNNGSLIIKQVDLKHEGHYACVKNVKDDMVSLIHLVEVIVQPRPPSILVEGCALFHPCFLTVRRGEPITCKVNGVRPQVGLSIVADPPIGIITNADTVSRADGLFYTTIRGYVDVNKATCGENITIICKARGPASVGFKSDVHITSNIVGEDCLQATTIISPEQEHHLIMSFTRVVAISTSAAICIIIVAIIVIVRKKVKRRSDQKDHKYGMARIADTCVQCVERIPPSTEETC